MPSPCCQTLTARLLPRFLREFDGPATHPRLAWTAWISVLLLAVIWPVPNGQLLFHRNFALFLGFLSLLALSCSQPGTWSVAFRLLGRRLLALLGLLSLWVLITGVWHSGSGLGFLSMYNGKWLRMLETGFMGLVLVQVLLTDKSSRLEPVDLFWGLLCAMWLIPLLQMLDVMRVWQQTHQFPWQFTRLAYSRMELSVSIGIVIAFLCAEIAARLALGRRWLPASWWQLLLMLGVSLFSQLGLATRNATIGLAGIVFSVTILVVLLRAQQWRRRTLIASICVGLGLLCGIALLSWNSDARWQGFSQTVPIALDTSHNLAWRDNLHYKYPAMPNGKEVEVSAYERIAWMKIGSWLVLQEPLGQGIYGNNFHRLVGKYFGETTTTQSHSGMINFTLANGLPGLGLWLLILGGLLMVGARSFYRDGQIPGLFLMTFVLGLSVRSIFDDIWRDHMLEMFFFYSAFLLSLCAGSSDKAPNQPAAGCVTSAKREQDCSR